jgi:hypothetical protein
VSHPSLIEQAGQNAALGGNTAENSPASADWPYSRDEYEACGEPILRHSEHTYRLARHTLGWDKTALRHPEQAARRTWLIIAAITQLRLARPIAEDHRQHWERRRS